MTKLFYENDLSLDTIWRAIVLLGRNNKTYKFALAKSLLQLAAEGKQSIKISELAPVFAKNTLEHVVTGNSQGAGQGNNGLFLTACEKRLSGEITDDELYSITEKEAFGDVIKRFHTVNNSETPISFYDFSNFKTEKRIVIRDEVFNLLSSKQGSSLIQEIEARWKLVENAWELKIDPRLLDVLYDEDQKLFFINKKENGKTRRVNVTQSRDALNGYQKGHCFYCFSYISVNAGDQNLCHVDHFFPHTLFDKLETKVNYNGVWNLVLACSACNKSKLAKVPKIKYMERLHTRNEFYVTSHLPLKESILKTGKSEVERRKFLQMRYNESKNILISEFETNLIEVARF